MLVAAADAAQATLDAAEGANKLFRSVGARVSLFEQFNTLRRSTDAKLATLGLPASSVDGFFKHESPRPGRGRLRKSKDIQAEIETTKERLGVLDAELATAQQAEKDAAQRKLDAQKSKATAATLRQNAKAADKLADEAEEQAKRDAKAARKKTTV